MKITYAIYAIIEKNIGNLWLICCELIGLLFVNNVLKIV